MKQVGVVMVLVLMLAGSGCGITGPKVNFGKADGSIASAEGPGIAGNMTDPKTGTVVSSGSLYFNPAAAAAMIFEYVGNLFHKGSAAAKSVGAGA